MKTRLLAIAMLLCTFAAKAQYVTIPDPAFVQFLQLNYPNCMNGNQMDTTCSEIVSADYVECSHAGINDLEGIQYFDSLGILSADHNNLTSIPPLSPFLRQFFCDYNILSSLPPLLHNTRLTEIVCDSNLLTSLPALPANLQSLECAMNNITSIPSLPNNIYSLDFSDNPITSLPALPDSLIWIECRRTQLTALPSLPANLIELYVNGNQISVLPSLPSTLRWLDCSENLLSSLPPLPQLTHLYIRGNQFTTMPQLPSSLFWLDCSDNNLGDLGALPMSIRYLYCNSTNISSLPPLPPYLTTLHCGNNNLSSFTDLPNGLIVLHCYQNPMNTIPALPQLRELQCYNSPNLTSIGQWYDTLGTAFLHNCPQLNCLPKTIHITQYINFSNTGIICLPNYFTAAVSQPNINNIPVCIPGNTNGCATYADLSGRTYHDKNHNCTFEGADQGQYGLKHSLYSNGILLGQTYSNSAGNYSFDVNAYGNYETRLDTTYLPFIIACPNGGVYIDTLTATDSTHFSRNFALECKTGFDIAAYSVASSMIFRPANNTIVDIHAGDLANFYRASCAQSVSGTVTVKLHGPISYIAPANGAVAPSNVSNNILTWNVADFGTADALNDFNITIQTDTFAQSGQQACFEVNVTPLAGDNDTSNNHIYYCFNIVNSYDPNDKTAYPSGNIDTTQEWLTYTVRFQNTGSAEAQHIYIVDTLDADVDAASFQLLSYSHQPNVQIKENIVRFNFPFINLPDSNTNEPGSHGYVQYKVKLKEDLPIGTAINNTAYIYFDFNPPVVTNTATNTIAVEEDTVEVGIKGIQRDMGTVLYPNPANSQVTVSGNAPLYSITIYDIVGRIRLAQNVSGTSATIDISNLPSGLYVVGTGSSNKRLRLVKQ